MEYRMLRTLAQKRSSGGRISVKGKYRQKRGKQRTMKHNLRKLLAIMISCLLLLPVTAGTVPAAQGAVNFDVQVNSAEGYVNFRS